MYADVSSSHACAQPPGPDSRTSSFQYSALSCHHEMLRQRALVWRITCRAACSTSGWLEPCPFTITIRVKPW